VTGCTSSSPSTTADLDSGSSPASSPADPSPSESAPDYQPLPEQGFGRPLASGLYGLRPIGPQAQPVAVVNIPVGFVGGSLLFPVDEQSGSADECCIVGYWTVARVYQDPCKATVAKDPGPSVQDLADALTAQQTASTKPTPVTLGGYDGVYLELTAPAGLGDLSSCKGGELNYWESDPGTRHFDGSHYDQSQGLPVERVWIIDVAGQRLVLSVGVESGIDDQQAQPLIDIVSSTQFVAE